MALRLLVADLCLNCGGLVAEKVLLAKTHLRLYCHGVSRNCNRNQPTNFKNSKGFH